ncbi:MAG: SDR family oxidoreductase [Nanoarchaeota archaeon]|nr:SDR family oxidoreductase [Nanoarchaeota archaeon]MBU1029781.1 SDR family oxidoreductase [Nanoarchaeota archaeon]MBU1850304.1 SDR family oxidoreductase [Nanoarchaeota archaeon]
MKCLVTGGAGFIGSHIVDKLISKKHQVVIIDNLSTGKRKNINKKAKFYKADLRSKKIDNIFKKEKPEIIFHTAAHINVRYSVTNPVYDANNNILGGLNLLETCKKYGVKKIIYSSTGGAIYGNPEYMPCDEKHPIRPICPYGASKYSFEKYLFIYKELHGLNYTILRYANVFGPRQDPKGEAGVISIFLGKLQKNQICTINGTGKQTRDFVYVEDVANANILAMDKASGQIINIGVKEETDVNTIYEKLAKIMNKDLKPKHGPKVPGEVEKIYLDNTLAKKILKWKPEVSFDNGLEKTVKYFSS